MDPSIGIIGGADGTTAILLTGLPDLTALAGWAAAALLIWFLFRP